MIQVRQIQKSKTGFYINLPKKFVDKLKINGSECVKFTLDEENSKIILELIDLQNNK